MRETGDEAFAGSLEIDGRRVGFREGESLLELAARNGIEIPSLCDDSRLDPRAACRACLVEVEGRARLQPACALTACEGLRVRTDSPRVARHRRSLFGLYLADHPAGPASGAASGRADRLHEIATRHAAPRDWGRMDSRRPERLDARNPYVAFDAERCILCARCTRYCEEVEGVSAIALHGRGPETSVSTREAASLLDTTCELCGGCIDVCPTGAMHAKPDPMQPGEPRERRERVRTTCNYCGVGCQLDLVVDAAAHAGRGRVIGVENPAPGTTSNDGNLCVKGRFGFDFIDHPERLTRPLVRGEDGELHETSWEDALARAAAGLQGVRQRHGADALGFVSSSRCTLEENYLVQKLARAVFGTHNVHQCAAT